MPAMMQLWRDLLCSDCATTHGGFTQADHGVQPAERFWPDGQDSARPPNLSNLFP